MSELFLIAHKVRGEPAFDVAQQMECPECIVNGNPKLDENGDYAACAECDNEGFWWIIPTSGHRAYPWWHRRLAEIELLGAEGPNPWDTAEMPEGLPDHYTTHASPTRPLLEALLPKAPVYRRF